MEKLMSPKEVSKATGLKISYLYHLTHQKRIPFLKLGNTVKFRASDIEKWLTGCMVSVSEEKSKGKKELKQKAKKETKTKRNTFARSIAEKAKKEVLGLNFG